MISPDCGPLGADWRRATTPRRADDSDRQARAAASRHAFTLLEVLVTVLISSVLLMSLWALLDMYARLFDAGQTKAGQTQLLCGLMRQISDDLQSAIQDTAEAPPGTLGPVRRFGLFGSAHTLQFDMIQPAPPQNAGTSTMPSGNSLDEPLAAEAYELRTVRYEFVPPTDLAQSDPTARPGLTRHELDFKTTESTGPEETVATLTEQPQEAPAFDMASDQGASQQSLMEALAPDPNDNTVSWVPEVVALEFRYFDGMVWTSTWDSLQRKSLPAAVEVAMQLSPSDEMKPPQSPATPSSSEEMPAETLDMLGLEEREVAPGGLGCRLVIDLPTSVLRNVLDRQRDESLPSTDEFDPTLLNADVMLDELFDEETLPDMSLDQPPGSRSRRPRGFGRTSSSDRTLIQQKAPDQWMRGR